MLILLFRFLSTSSVSKLLSNKNKAALSTFKPCLFNLGISKLNNIPKTKSHFCISLRKSARIFILFWDHHLSSPALYTYPSIVPFTPLIYVCLSSDDSDLNVNVVSSFVVILGLWFEDTFEALSFRVF